MRTQIPIYETDNFYIQAAKRPFIDRSEGGHLYLFPKIEVRDRTKLSASLAIEYIEIIYGSWRSACFGYGATRG